MTQNPKTNAHTNQDNIINEINTGLSTGNAPVSGAPQPVGTASPTMDCVKTEDVNMYIPGESSAIARLAIDATFEGAIIGEKGEEMFHTPPQELKDVTQSLGLCAQYYLANKMHEKGTPQGAPLDVQMLPSPNGQNGCLLIGTSDRYGNPSKTRHYEEVKRIINSGSDYESNKREIMQYAEKNGLAVLDTKPLREEIGRLNSKHQNDLSKVGKSLKGTTVENAFGLKGSAMGKAKIYFEENNTVKSGFHQTHLLVTDPESRGSFAKDTLRNKSEKAYDSYGSQPNPYESRMKLGETGERMAFRHHTADNSYSIDENGKLHYAGLDGNELAPPDIPPSVIKANPRAYANFLAKKIDGISYKDANKIAECKANNKPIPTEIVNKTQGIKERRNKPEENRAKSVHENRPSKPKMSSFEKIKNIFKKGLYTLAQAWNEAQLKFPILAFKPREVLEKDRDHWQSEVRAINAKLSRGTVSVAPSISGWSCEKYKMTNKPPSVQEGDKFRDTQEGLANQGSANLLDNNNSVHFNDFKDDKTPGKIKYTDILQADANANLCGPYLRPEAKLAAMQEILRNCTPEQLPSAQQRYNAVVQGLHQVKSANPQIPALQHFQIPAAHPDIGNSQAVPVPQGPSAQQNASMQRHLSRMQEPHSPQCSGIPSAPSMPAAPQSQPLTITINPDGTSQLIQGVTPPAQMHSRANPSQSHAMNGMGIKDAVNGIQQGQKQAGQDTEQHSHAGQHPTRKSTITI